MKKNNNSFRMVFKYTNGYRLYFILAGFTIILRVVANFVTPKVIAFTVDSVIDNKPVAISAFLRPLIEAVGGRDVIRQNIWYCGIAVLIFALITCICEYFSKTFIAKGSEGTVKNLRNHLYEHIQKLPYSWHVKNQTGDIIQRSTSDVEVVRTFISVHLSEMFRIIMLIIIALIMMFSTNVKLSLISLAFVPVVMTYTGVFYGILARRFLVADEAEGDMFASAQENLTGVRVVRAFGREQYEIDKFSKKNEKFSEMWVRLGYKLGYYWGIGDLFSGMQVMTVLIFGVIEAVDGVITLGEFLAFISYNSMLVWPVRSFGRVLSEMSKAGVSIGRINEILSEEEEHEDENALTPDMNKDIVFDHVTFRYEDSQPILSDLSFTIKAGTTFAILGGTGSGKTTLMHLLNRLYDLDDDSGSISIGGVNIKDIKLSYLRSNIGMVLQEPFLFSKTIVQNIGITKDDYTMEQIRKVSEIADVNDAIESFSNGYDTIVGERGVTLSGGQKQRVAIARMLMQDAPIMVFDDSLSAVDSETDLNIRNALRINRQGATTILISHRITTLMRADMIMVLDKGEISDMGTHDELIKRDGIYKDIYDVQMSMSEAE